MKGKINPDLEIGDRIVLYHMEDETSVVPGTQGTVTNITNDPFEPGTKIISVDWENGSKLSLLSSTDFWKKIVEDIQEDRHYDFFSKHPEVFEYFDWRFLSNYLEKLRESGITNMFGASPFLYCGRDHIERYYGENPSDEDAFEEVLDLSNMAKDKMIQGTVKWMESNNKEVTVDNVNRYISKMAQKITLMFAQFIH